MSYELYRIILNVVELQEDELLVSAGMLTVYRCTIDETETGLEANTNIYSMKANNNQFYNNNKTYIIKSY